MKVLAGAVFCLVLYTVGGSFTSEYYENLISQRTTEARAYEMPESNVEFQRGASSPESNDFGSYDFIVVGAGSAGSVLATRLSEVPDWSVLLLEAGGEEDDFNAIPGMFPYLQFSDMNWGYFTTPQTNCCLGMRDRRCPAPRGKSVGGSGAINAVLYVRGNAKDYDKWVELGNPGWSHEEVLPYFVKSENSQIHGDEGYHGKGGVWDVEYALPPAETFSTLIDANAELNATTLDYNGLRQLGVSKTQTNIKHGKRQSAATAFLDNSRKRENLKLVTRALVTKIDIDAEGVARGVIFTTRDQKFVARAAKEVIVSAGAVNSPQLLMLSGVGPRDHLEDLEIETVADLPVGRNLQEHPHFLGLNFRTNYTAPSSDFGTAIEEYLTGLGPLTTTAEALGFLHAGDVPDDVPMIKYIFNPPSGPGGVPIADRIYNFDDDLVTNYLNKMNSSTDFGFSLILLHPKSRGRITLKSNDPIDFPNIDLNMFSESEDIDNFIEGIDFVLKLTQTEAFRRMDASLVEIPICDQFEPYSRSFWECAVRHMSMTLYHPCGTTAMGPDGTTSVVDGDLKVHGIDNLRVVDAGVFPSTISGPTNAAVIMVAEKISDVIKNYYDKTS
ncbi:hypothetical protein MTP99_011574 [Tenebrio molitor]|uniref:glucose dehydrogenase [FAD, quinone]-like n=1 Tax=Tenebrio molitor TaxID=7067 RepID=UPI002701502C|nr:hypothetical protein MTP99_011574 [Tenebrio molitor]